MENKNKISIFCKEELPTWNEIYNEFYLHINSYLKYNPDDENQTLDLYWKIPRKKMLLGTICNQLNKIIYEDINKDEMFNYLNSIHPKINPRNVCFTLHQISPSSHVSQTSPPFIYYCPLPTGEKNIFQLSNVPRIDLSKLTMELCLLLNIEHSITSPININQDPIELESYINFIKYLIKDIIEYYENGIGWKDIISSKESINRCVGVGQDPAL